MKNFSKLFGIIALVAVIGFSMAACDNGTTGGDLEKVTNFDISSPADFAAAVTQIASNGAGASGDPKKYSFTVNSAVTIPAMTPDFLPFYIEITFKGNGSLTLSGAGSLLLVGANQTFIIDSAGLNLVGNGSNGSLVTVNGTKAKLELKAGTIKGNTSEEGGGVIVIEGVFNMSGGTISGNTATNRGGGVEVSDDGVFTLSGGFISGNTVTGGGGAGGVYVRGAVIMTGGFIQSNNAGSGPGGGVNVRDQSNTIFTMTGGTIYGNTEGVTSLRNITSGSGAALYNDSSGKATNGGTAISTTNNTIVGTPAP